MRELRRPGPAVSGASTARWRKAALVVGLAGLVVCLHGAGLSADALTRWIPFRCPFHLVTGLECFGCGPTRSVVAALAGVWPESVRHHPLGIPLVLGALIWLLGARARTSRSTSRGLGAGNANSSKELPNTDPHCSGATILCHCPRAAGEPTIGRMERTRASR